jgi:hypothetical protein
MAIILKKEVQRFCTCWWFAVHNSDSVRFTYFGGCISENNPAGFLPVQGQSRPIVKAFSRGGVGNEGATLSMNLIIQGKQARWQCFVRAAELEHAVPPPINTFVCYLSFSARSILEASPVNSLTSTDI